MDRIGQYLVEKYQVELSRELGRPAEEIAQKGLSAYDFSHSNRVEIKTLNEMDCSFECAFAVISENKKRVAVFTEHVGYHEFSLSRTRVSSITDFYSDDYYE